MGKKMSFKVIMIFFIFSILGLFLIQKVSWSLNPSHSLPSLTVECFWPNASAKTIERTVTSPLEEKFSAIKGLKNIESVSASGSTRIILELNKATEIEAARFEVSTIIKHVYQNFPEDVTFPVVRINRTDADEDSFLTYAVSSDLTNQFLYKFIESKIIPTLKSVSDIDDIRLFGGQRQEYVIEYDRNVLYQMGISLQELEQAILKTFSIESLGVVTDNSSVYTVFIDGIQDLNKPVPVKKIGDRIIYLNDITEIRLEEKIPESYFRVNGKEAIIIDIAAKKNANILEVAKDVKVIMTQIKSDLSSDIDLYKSYDSTEYIRAELDKIYWRTFYTLGILCVFIIIVSRSFRVFSIVILSLFVNVTIAFGLYYLLGIEIQLYSLAGITISLGLIIDNIMIIMFHIRDQGNLHAFKAVLAATLTTLGALGTIFFMEENLRLNLLDFAWIVIINLSLSLLVALFFVPALMHKIPLKSRKKNPAGAESFLISSYRRFLFIVLPYRKYAFILLIFTFGIPLFLLPEKVEEDNTFFARLYNNTLGSNWYKTNLKSTVDKYTGGTLRLFNLYVFEESIYEHQEESRLVIVGSTEKGGTVSQFNEVFLQIDAYLSQFSEIKRFTTQVYNNQYARVEVFFHEESLDQLFPFYLKSKLSTLISDFGGITWGLYGVGSSFSINNIANTDPVVFSVKATGYHYNTLNTWADSLRGALETNPRVENVQIKENNPRPKLTSYGYDFWINSELQAMVGISKKEILNHMKEMVLSTTPDLQIYRGGEYLPVRFESIQSIHNDLWHLKWEPLQIVSKPFIKSIFYFEKVPEEDEIYRVNQEFVRKVVFNYTGSHKMGGDFLNDKINLINTQAPLGFKFEKEENPWMLKQKEKQNYLLLLILAVGIIYFITSVLFESLWQGFAVLGIIPISFIGVFLTFYLFDLSFDQGGLASFVLLTGITVNASIFIIAEYNNQKKYAKTNSLNLYITAFQYKITPILLTILSTILGFIPFIKDGQKEVFWFAIAIGTIGGLVFSLIGIFVFLPMLIVKKF